MGTRFIATKEAPVHENVKQAILNATELDTRLVMRPLRNTERVLTNPAVERLLAKEKELGANIKFEDIIAEVAGVYPKIMMDGDMDAGAWSCGMVVGLIHDIPTCKELIDGMMAEAEAIIRSAMKARPIATIPSRPRRDRSSGASVRWGTKSTKGSRKVCHTGRAEKASRYACHGRSRSVVRRCRL
jgi:hypothetical protein